MRLYNLTTDIISHTLDRFSNTCSNLTNRIYTSVLLSRLATLSLFACLLIFLIISAVICIDIYNGSAQSLSLLSTLSHTGSHTALNKITRFLYLLSMFSFCCMLILPRRKALHWLAALTILFIFVAFQSASLLHYLTFTLQKTLQAYLTAGSLAEFPGSNLNTGIHMATNFLQGKGITVGAIGSEVPPWHRMPGYGLFWQ